MLRETAITYSSVPQDEDTSSHPIISTTRPAGNPHTKRDCQLTGILTALVIICLFSLLVILPLVLQYRSNAKGRGEIPEQLTGELHSESNHHTQVVGNENIKEQSGSDSLASANNSKNSTEAAGSEPPKKKENTTHKPVTKIPTTAVRTTTTTTTTTSTTTTTTTTTTTPAPTTTPGVAEKPVGGGEESGVSGQAGQSSGNSSGVHKQDGSLGTEEAQLQNPGTSEKNVSKEDILNEIYGSDDNLAKPVTTHSNSGWLDQMMAREDIVPLMVLVAVVAVASVGVIAATIWLVYHRVTLRRRRVNMQSVITDLQSRDKIVLLNSEESEEE